MGYAFTVVSTLPQCIKYVPRGCHPWGGGPGYLPVVTWSHVVLDDMVRDGNEWHVEHLLYSQAMHYAHTDIMVSHTPLHTVVLPMGIPWGMCTTSALEVVCTGWE